MPVLRWSRTMPIDEGIPIAVNVIPIDIRTLNYPSKPVHHPIWEKRDLHCWTWQRGTNAFDVVEEQKYPGKIANRRRIVQGKIAFVL